MIYQIFLNACQRTPDAIAIVTSKGYVYTYVEAKERVQQWANYLLSKGIKKGDRVGVLLDNEDHHVFILLALNRINASYAPFDTDIPKGQLAIDIREFEINKFILEESLDADFEIDPDLALKLSDKELAHIESFESSEPFCEYSTDGSTEVYLVSSSGSTGAKKGIPIKGAALKLYWYELLQELFKDYPLDKMLATRSPGYDARIFEYLLAFSTGAELHLLNRLQRKDFSSILARCESSSISCLLLIASQLNTANTEMVVSRLNSYGVKHLMVTGDTCTPLLKESCEQQDVSLWNCYGPTEAVFGMSILRVNGLPLHYLLEQAIVPVGMPYGDEVRCRLINGTLHINSPYLTIYLKKEHNDAAFIEIDGERWFDTGDEADIENGHIILKGRKGHCKINGVKVTTPVIEERIRNYSKESYGEPLQVAVVVKRGRDNQEKFVAYLVIPPEFNRKAFLEYLKAFFRKEEFPTLICLNALPILHPSDKVDKRQLETRQDQSEESFFYIDEERAEGDMSVHHAVKTIWCELFNLENVPVDVEFLYLGGTSIHALEMVNKIIDRLDSSYTYADLLNLEEVTINSVVQSITDKKRLNPNQALIKGLYITSERERNIFLLPALLGEGYFSYRHLAVVLAKNTYSNIYGLSDPGIVDESLLPESMKQAVDRYICAIKSVQKTGRYHLMGFSFGCTLAYEVAKELLARGDEVREVHLLDGYPPYVYQALPDFAYANLLKSLFDFMIVTLNNRFYQEKLEAIELVAGTQALDKLGQVELNFSQLEKKLKNPASKRLIAIARAHLRFLLTTSMPDKKIPLAPTFYLTNKDQPYLKIIEYLPNVPTESSDYAFFFWSRYFSNIIRCGVTLPGDHLSIVRDDSSNGAEAYWQKTKTAHYTPGLMSDFLAEIEMDYHHSIYRLEKVNEEEYELSIFFIEEHSAKALKLLSELDSIGLSYELMRYEKHNSRVSRQDTSYYSGFCLFFDRLGSSIKLIRPFLKTLRIHEITAKKEFSQPADCYSLESLQVGKIDLIVLWKEERLTTISFSYYAAPQRIIDVLQEKFHISPIDYSPDKPHIVYEYTIQADESLSLYSDQTFSQLSRSAQTEVLEETQDFITDFICLLKPYVHFLMKTTAASEYLEEVSSDPLPNQAASALALMRAKLGLEDFELYKKFLLGNPDPIAAEDIITVLNSCQVLTVETLKKALTFPNFSPSPSTLFAFATSRRDYTLIYANLLKLNLYSEEVELLMLHNRRPDLLCNKLKKMLSENSLNTETVLDLFLDLAENQNHHALSNKAIVLSRK